MRRAVLLVCALLGALLIAAQPALLGPAIAHPAGQTSADVHATTDERADAPVDDPEGDPADDPGDRVDEPTETLGELEPLLGRSGDPSGPDGERGPALPSPGERLRSGDVAAGLLTRQVPVSGSGEFDVVGGSTAAPDDEADRQVTLSIEVEQDLHIDAERFGEFVLRTLNDERSWPGTMSVSFARTDTDPDFRVLLATPETVDAECDPLPTGGEYSCATGSAAVLNAMRWTEAVEPYQEPGASLTDYRRYLVNHEVGHLLGHDHVECPEAGEPAPVMQQQSISLGECEPNGWVVPD